jgi:hypothetical protein
VAVTSYHIYYHCQMTDVFIIISLFNDFRRECDLTRCREMSWPSIRMLTKSGSESDSGFGVRCDHFIVHCTSPSRSGRPPSPCRLFFMLFYVSFSWLRETLHCPKSESL